MLLPTFYNYIGIFLTLRCPYKCSYCINWKVSGYEEISGKVWVEALKNICTPLSITLGGGEPTIHRDFYEIINGIPQKIELLTNLFFDVDEFIKEVSPDKFRNERSFAPIRASFHSEMMDPEETYEKVIKLGENGFRVGLYCVDHPYNKDYIEWFILKGKIDFQVKPLLPNKQEVKDKRFGLCRTRELLVAPNGCVYKCHRDLYHNEYAINKLGSMLCFPYKFRECSNATDCHPCDLKVKRDRFGKEGYCAVDRRLI